MTTNNKQYISPSISILSFNIEGGNRKSEQHTICTKIDEIINYNLDKKDNFIIFISLQEVSSSEICNKIFDKYKELIIIKQDEGAFSRKIKSILISNIKNTGSKQIKIRHKIFTKYSLITIVQILDINYIFVASHFPIDTSDKKNMELGYSKRIEAFNKVLMEIKKITTKIDKTKLYIFVAGDLNFKIDYTGEQLDRYIENEKQNDYNIYVLNKNIKSCKIKDKDINLLKTPESVNVLNNYICKCDNKNKCSCTCSDNITSDVIDVNSIKVILNGIMCSKIYNIFNVFNGDKEKIQVDITTIIKYLNNIDKIFKDSLVHLEELSQHMNIIENIKNKRKDISTQITDNNDNIENITDEINSIKSSSNNDDTIDIDNAEKLLLLNKDIQIIKNKNIIMANKLTILNKLLENTNKDTTIINDAKTIIDKYKNKAIQILTNIETKKSTIKDMIDKNNIIFTYINTEIDEQLKSITAKNIFDINITNKFKINDIIKKSNTLYDNIIEITNKMNDLQMPYNINDLMIYNNIIPRLSSSIHNDYTNIKNTLIEYNNLYRHITLKYLTLDEKIKDITKEYTEKIKELNKPEKPENLERSENAESKCKEYLEMYDYKKRIPSYCDRILLILPKEYNLDGPYFSKDVKNGYIQYNNNTNVYIEYDNVINEDLYNVNINSDHLPIFIQNIKIYSSPTKIKIIEGIRNTYSQAGGYYIKYIKYKQKYLELKELVKYK